MARVGQGPHVITMQPGYPPFTPYLRAIPSYVHTPIHHQMQQLEGHPCVALTGRSGCLQNDVIIQDGNKVIKFGTCAAVNTFRPMLLCVVWCIESAHWLRIGHEGKLLDRCCCVWCGALNVRIGGELAMKTKIPSCECFCCDDKVIMYIESPADHKIGLLAVRESCCGTEYLVKDASGNIAFRFSRREQCCKCCQCLCPTDCCQGECGDCCTCCDDVTTYVKVFDAEGISEVAYIRRVYGGCCSCDKTRRYFLAYLRPNEPIGNKALIMGTALIIDYYNLHPLLNQQQYSRDM